MKNGYFAAVNIKAHFQKLLEALQIERKEEQDNYGLHAKESTIRERVEAGITLYPLEFLTLNYRDSGDIIIDLKVNPKQEGTAFGMGKTVSLFNADGEDVEGQMLSFRSQIVEIKIGREDVLEWIKKGKIGLNALADIKTFHLFEKTIKDILAEKKYPLLEHFYGKKSNEQAVEFSIPLLNTAQNSAVAEILSDNSISIIHGPPGTGKTTTLVAAIKELTKVNKRILLCTASNAAADNVCSKLLSEQIGVVRIGNEAKIDATVSRANLYNQIKGDRSYKLLTQLKIQAENIREKAFKYKRNFGKEEYSQRKRLKQELRSLYSDIRKIHKDIGAGIIERAPIICGTFYSVQGAAMASQRFDYVIIDEAGQAIEPAIWSVAHFGKKLVLAGDDLQLAPVLKSRGAEELGLATSLLKRATEMSFPKHLLNIQYRMHQSIMEFSNQQFYGGKLRADASVANHSLSGNSYLPVEFIDTAGCGYEEKRDSDNGGIINEGEIKVLENVLKEYDTSKYTVGIITPYRAQLNKINSTGSNSQAYANTVDSFQGQEREVILISMVRSNESAEIGFLKDYRRMNVAMTRAKKKLVVIGDSATIGQDSFYSNFLDYVEAHGSYRTAWEFN